jgi:hypothetical protein
MTDFSIRVNDGPEQTLSVKTGIYQHAAAAAVAILDLDLPAKIDIWVPALLPQYGPLTFLARDNEYGHLTVGIGLAGSAAWREKHGAGRGG